MGDATYQALAMAYCEGLQDSADADCQDALAWACVHLCTHSDGGYYCPISGEPASQEAVPRTCPGDTCDGEHDRAFTREYPNVRSDTVGWTYAYRHFVDMQGKQGR